MRASVRWMFLLGLGLGVIAGCGQPKTTCSPANCSGCCSAEGACLVGDAQDACGSLGGACWSCGESEQCTQGTCFNPGTANFLDGGTDAGVDSGVPDAGYPLIEQLLAEHNTVRANAKPVPNPALAPLQWSDEVAAYAAAYAEKCEYKHNPQLGTKGYGENIGAKTGQSFTPREIVTAWASEDVDYDYATNTCAAGKKCGHYTQIVWRSTKYVGCARKICTKNSPFGTGTWTFWVCDYAPPGNYIGKKPY